METDFTTSYSFCAPVIKLNVVLATAFGRCKQNLEIIRSWTESYEKKWGNDFKRLENTCL